ncbi:MAG TPA: hypothetical protein VFI23_12700 [Rhizomicrobium sp.]|nr:hypothetical protein [Rhizomicrobium sp.]
MRQFWWLLVPAILGATMTLAQARPRDDALSSAIRCGVIADSRAWLDCYYGSAQPVRAALSLGSALPAQIALAASPPAGGQPRDDAVRAEVVAAAAGCMRMPEDRPWLDCYYAAAMPMRGQLGLSGPQPVRAAPMPAPAQQFVSAPPPPARSGPPPMPRSGGILTGLFYDGKPIVRNMPMQSYVRDKTGSFTVTLADGQVWEQIEEDQIYHPARWRKDAAQMLVTIKPDMMNTFIMTIYGENYMYKVHRVR